MLTEDPDDAFLKTLTVLLVEDEPSALEEIGRFLRRRVGRLVSAPDGAAGLAAFAEARPDLVVTDLQMPNMDGLAMAAELRSLAPAVPIIVTTAFEQTGYLVRSIELGIDRYVLKPIRAEHLEAALRVCAHRLRAESELRLQAQREEEARRARLEAAHGMLLGGLAHDYNNLVQGILASVTMARLSAPQDNDHARHLDLAERCSEEARLLSRRLAFLSGAPEPLTATGPLEPLVREVLEEALGGSGIALEFAFGEGAWAVRHHPERLAQALRQVAVNAREAMGAGGTLQVATGVCFLEAANGLRVPPGRYLRIAFRDTGCGIPPDHLALVFEPYFTTKARGSQRGTGLGLAMAMAILRAHGGAIHAEPVSGPGSLLVLHLPLYSIPAEGAPVPEGQV